MIRQLHLYGPLRELAGAPTLELDVDTPVMLINGLRSQVKGFRQWCNEHKLAIVTTDAKQNATPVTAEDFALSLGKTTDIYLLPETEGAGFTAVAAWLASYGITNVAVAVVATIAVNVAVSVVVGTVMQALAPSPSTGSGAAQAAERPSFLYNGAVNVVEQGYAVPIVYGTHMVGSIVISAGVSSEDIPYESAQAEAPANGGGEEQPGVPPVTEFQWGHRGS